ncbi:fimbria/pilus periplasmic chaperone [Qipengyuania sp. NPDC077563]|uniref:fimbria/pilus periplasmic chaperone n=1 Tax=Qipengyuania sp. NPDC077563 TaxID=3364497 RepID=UPI00384CC9C5
MGTLLRQGLKILAGFGLIFYPVTGQAAKISPMIVELKPAGQNSIARVELTNDSLRDIPFEAVMMRGVITEDGELEMSPAEEQFLVFPAQAIVEGNSQQVFRVQYVGEPELSQSEIYYLALRQVPVEFEGETTQVQIVVNYNVLVNVVPDGTAPVAAVAEINPSTQDEKDGLSLLVRNDGNRYFMAGLSDWIVTGTTSDGNRYEGKFKGGELTRHIGVGVVGPGRTRRFFLPTDVKLNPGSVQVEINP